MKKTSNGSVINGNGSSVDNSVNGNGQQPMSKSKLKKLEKQLQQQQQQQLQQQQIQQQQSEQQLIVEQENSELIKKALIETLDEELENEKTPTTERYPKIDYGKDENEKQPKNSPQQQQPQAQVVKNNLEEVDLNVNSFHGEDQFMNQQVVQQQPLHMHHHPNGLHMHQNHLNNVNINVNSTPPTANHNHHAHYPQPAQHHVQPVQPVHPIQTVQPYANSNLQRTTTITPNSKPSNPMQQHQHQHQHSTSSSSPPPTSNVNFTKQHHHQQQQQHNYHQQIKPLMQDIDASTNEISLESSNNSIHQMDTQYSMSQPQSLDNNVIDRILNDETKSHLILDDQEVLQVKSAQEFVSLFKNQTLTRQPQHQHQHQHQHPPSDDKLVKCVAIFGNTGDGKSHTLNHTFFNGRGIFKTSDQQETCTMGVWCAFDPITNALIFDTEGLLGTTNNEEKRVRMLLKALAISDVIIYRTRAERLHNDLFQFLSEASVAYMNYFNKELEAAAEKLKPEPISSLGPDCVLFHETQHTDVLADEFDAFGNPRTVLHQLYDRFAKLNLSYNAYSSLTYVGTRTAMNGGPYQQQQQLVGQFQRAGTDFSKLALKIRELLSKNSVRTPRKLSSIYHVLKALNDKFSGDINKNDIVTFADKYFTCGAHCLSCGKRCKNSINHLKDGILHECSDKCHYNHQYDNKVYVCQRCHQNGKEVIVIPKTAASNENSLIGIMKYTYSGYVLECPNHGVIYRSRQYWYGNPDPEAVVRTELKHIWPGQQNNVGTSHNLSRKIIDNVSYIGDTLQTLSAKPTSIAKEWMADKVAPTYWVPNSEITECFACRKPFSVTSKKKHHCRGCGRGFCDKCSSKSRIIEWWSPTDSVRVCDACYDKEYIEEPYPMPNVANGPGSGSQATIQSSSAVAENSSLAMLGLTGNNDVIVRKVTESVQETIGYIGYATKLPLEVIKESARPSYWKPDSECVQCAICHKDFDPEYNPLHHCRSCGDGVCHACSPHLKPVPSRGWDTPVRVCNNCNESTQNAK